MISLRNVDDLVIYYPSEIKGGYLGEFRKFFRRCAEDFLRDPSQEKRILEEIETAIYLDDLRKKAMCHMLKRTKIEAEANKKMGL